MGCRTADGGAAPQSRTHHFKSIDSPRRRRALRFGATLPAKRRAFHVRPAFRIYFAVWPVARDAVVLLMWSAIKWAVATPARGAERISTRAATAATSISRRPSSARNLSPRFPPTRTTRTSASFSRSAKGAFPPKRATLPCSTPPNRSSVKSSYQPDSLEMISFMISEVPPPMVINRMSRQARAMSVSSM